jgi:chromosomal replication initiation ATPase DnaA
MPHIKVAIRIKPEQGDKLKGFYYQVREGDKCRIELTASGTKNEFNFDHLFDENASQDQIFSICCVPIIQNVLDGQNGTLFAYGQTGAGKTHTVTGPETEEYEERGLCMRSADYIFRKIRSIKDAAFTVKFSVIEIYNDSVLDLLRENIKDSPKLIIVDTPDGVVVPALYLLPLENEEEAYTKLVEANLNR